MQSLHASHVVYQKLNRSSHWTCFCCWYLEKPSQNSENEQSSVSLEVLLVKVCHKKRKVKFKLIIHLFCTRVFHVDCVFLIWAWIFSFRMSAAPLSKCLQVKSRCLWILTVTKPSLVPTPPYWSPAMSSSPVTATWSSLIRSCSGCHAQGGGTPMVWSMERPMRTLVGIEHREIMFVETKMVTD